MAAEEEYSVLAAQITGAHGVTGNVRVRLIGDNPLVSAQSLTGSKTVEARPEAEGGEARMLTLLSLRKQTQAKGAWIAHFKEMSHRTDAEDVLGWGLFIPEAGRADLPDGEYYVDQLVGLRLVTDTGHGLGHLANVLHSPANDVYETDTGVLVPAVAAFVLSVDIPGGIITVRDMPGLREGGSE